ncbi:hypothetical protein [Caulobacter sp. NIBR2454]|uniref:hypothetical protein n=1 Tax=Caulobacter sp. NIBR2454 TaxID=3015996 RepID=UPI0022B5FDF4|nr:hypothetical protein [Caulobacter sp. NIBR2454]
MPRKKPKSPEQIAAEKAIKAAKERAQDFEAVGLAPDQSALAANSDVLVHRTDAKTFIRARRMDAFEALRRPNDNGAYNASRRLEQDMMIRMDLHDRGRPLERVDGERKTDRTDAICDAAKRVNAVLNLIGRRDGWLLTELIAPSASLNLSAGTWRDVVAYVTGEENGHAQAAVVRSAQANLAAAYQTVDGVMTSRVAC